MGEAVIFTQIIFWSVHTHYHIASPLIQISGDMAISGFSWFIEVLSGFML